MSDGHQAISTLELEDTSINLVISDLVMPNMGGRDLYNKVIDTYPETKMILMTGYPLGKNTRELLDREKMTWIQKPFTSEILAQTVQKILNQRVK